MRKPIQTMNDINLWEKVFHSLTDGVYITNAEGLTLNVNHAYEEITGLRRESLIGKKMSQIVEEGYLSISITKRVIETKKPVSMEQVINNGRNVVLNGFPIFDGDEILLVITFVRDITLINKIEADLSHSRLLINQYQKRINEMRKSRGFIAESPEFKKVISLARKVANVDSTVLILGESGTGKEVVAREVHEKSHRSKNLFLKINCGAIPENLLESELFGYEGGAFTGAKKSGHIGIFEMANKGTVFLDEIGDMPLHLQVKLLRVLQERSITRIGSTKPISLDTRVIAATNRDLKEMVQEKLFREDLYYRLNVISINLPPLRERKTDIPPLIDYFAANINEKYKLNKRLSPNLLKELMAYDWPGNVRELENMIERILVTSEETEITLKLGLLPWDYATPALPDLGTEEIIPLKEACENLERSIILRAAKKYKTTYEIAEALQISQPSVSRKLKKYREE